MEKIITIAQVIVPIFVAVFLGLLARKKQLLTPEQNQGLQQFVINFGLPCVIFNSCLTADIGAESLSSMALILPFMIIATFGAFAARKKKFPYFNFPQLFAAQETGMLGIPLFMILFGADQAYRIGVLDLTQAITAYPVIAMLSARTSENPSPKAIFKSILTSPLLIMSMSGLFLNLSGVGAWLDSMGILGIITESTGFLGQPISAMMIFSIGYNFSVSPGNRKAIVNLCLFHFVWFLVVCGIIQLGLSLVPGVDALTRWAVLLYCTLPASYLTPSLGKNELDSSVASGVCSVLTVVSLLIFCGMAAVLA